jgi:hypothetical protein
MSSPSVFVFKLGRLMAGCHDMTRLNDNTRWQVNDERRLSSFVVFYFKLSNPPSLSTMPAHRHHLATFHNSHHHPESPPLTPQRPCHDPQERQSHATSPTKQAPAAMSLSRRRRGNQTVNEKDGEEQKRRMTMSVVVHHLFYDIII